MLVISEVAAQRVKEMLVEQQTEGQKLYLRIGVKGGGCSGLSYGMGFDADVKEDDVHLNFHGVDVIVDKESSPMLDGVQIDFKQNMMGGGFTIDNPNAIASCGCGTSFRTKENAGTPGDC